jgi:hypothetical protein
MFSSSWVASWHPDDALRARFPTRGTDYRESLPDDFQAIVDAYAPFVKPHRWTFGLLDMWSPKAKMVKHAVHVSQIRILQLRKLLSNVEMPRPADSMLGQLQVKPFALEGSLLWQDSKRVLLDWTEANAVGPCHVRRRSRYGISLSCAGCGASWL